MYKHKIQGTELQRIVISNENTDLKIKIIFMTNQISSLKKIIKELKKN